MFRSYTKVALAAALTMSAFASVASAEENAKIKHMSFKVTAPFESEITVTSSDGDRWDTILPATVPLWADIVVNTAWPGYVERAGLYLGSCSETNCGSNPRIAFWGKDQRDWSFHGELGLDTGIIPVSTTGIATINVGDAAVGACNARLQNDGATANGISVSIPVTATLSVNTRRKTRYFFDSTADLPISDPSNPPFDGGDASTTHTFVMMVKCLPFTQIKAPPEPFKVDVLAQQQGQTCPKETEVTARIKYDGPATARFRFKRDGEPSQWIEAAAKQTGEKRSTPLGPKPVYLVEHVKTYHLDPGQHRFRVEVQDGEQSDVKTIEVDCPPFKVTSMWLTYKVEARDICPKHVAEMVTAKATRPGSAPFEIKTQSGAVVHSGTATFRRKGDAYVAEFGRDKLSFSNEFESDMMALIKDQPDANSGWVKLKVDCLEVLSGKLTLNSLDATSCKGEALVAIHTDGAGELPYELECGPGKSWQRKITAMANKIATDKVRFDVTNNEQVNCVLRTRIGGQLKSLDSASKTFQCHKPTDAGASTDLVPETRPEDPPPVGDTLTGDFSFVDSGGTQCPRQGKALINFKTSKPDNVHYSLDCTHGSFSGVAQTVPSPQGGYVAPAFVSFAVNKTTDAKCALKTVAPGKPKVHTLKGHTFQCVRTTDVDGADDLAPDTRPDPQAPEKPGTFVADPSDPAISCSGGAVKNGACVCELAFKPVKAGKNAWRCVRTVVDPKPLKPTVSEPKISCAGGAVKNGACVCEPSYKSVKAGANAWRCVKSVVDPKPVKPTVTTPKISCAGGTVKNGACSCARTHKAVKAGKNAWRCVVANTPKLEVKTAPKKTVQPKPATSTR